jgi:UDP-N-acetyl-D-mannosaminuronate dehydrogenase
MLIFLQAILALIRATKNIRLKNFENHVGFYETGRQVDALYQSVITAGTHLAPSIKVAEAAKVIENHQRDINYCFRKRVG